MNREPLITKAAIVAIVTTGLDLLVAFGLGLTPDQTGAILAFVTTVAPLVLAFIVRNDVTPTADPRNNNGEQLVPHNAEETS